MHVSQHTKKPSSLERQLTQPGRKEAPITHCWDTFSPCSMSNISGNNIPSHPSSNITSCYWFGSVRHPTYTFATPPEICILNPRAPLKTFSNLAAIMGGGCNTGCRGSSFADSSSRATGLLWAADPALPIAPPKLEFSRPDLGQDAELSCDVDSGWLAPDAGRGLLAELQLFARRPDLA